MPERASASSRDMDREGEARLVFLAVRRHDADRRLARALLQQPGRAVEDEAAAQRAGPVRQRRRHVLSRGAVMRGAGGLPVDQHRDRRDAAPRHRPAADGQPAGHRLRRHAAAHRRAIELDAEFLRRRRGIGRAGRDRRDMDRLRPLRALAEPVARHQAQHPGALARRARPLSRNGSRTAARTGCRESRRATSSRRRPSSASPSASPSRNTATALIPTAQTTQPVTARSPSGESSASSQCRWIGCAPAGSAAGPGRTSGAAAATIGLPLDRHHRLLEHPVQRQCLDRQHPGGQKFPGDRRVEREAGQGSLLVAGVHPADIRAWQADARGADPMLAGEELHRDQRVRRRRPNPKPRAAPTATRWRARHKGRSPATGEAALPRTSLATARWMLRPSRRRPAG